MLEQVTTRTSLAFAIFLLFPKHEDDSLDNSGFSGPYKLQSDT